MFRSACTFLVSNQELPDEVFVDLRLSEGGRVTGQMVPIRKCKPLLRSILSTLITPTFSMTNIITTVSME